MTWVPAIEPLDPDAMAAADERQGRLTKPPGSMGRLETLGRQLAGIAGVCPPPLPSPAAVAVFAGDHGVHAQGVTPWPQEVTAQMLANVTAGGAVVNAVARQVGADVVVVDVGVGRGTADLSQGPAMTRDQCRRAVETGISEAYRLVDAGYRLLVTGDLGLANTTPAAALVAAFTGRPAAEVTGRGAGADDAMWARKVAVVETALARLRPTSSPNDSFGDERAAAATRSSAERIVRREEGWALDVLAEVGGYEHAALAGFVLGGAARRVPVVLDGVIADSAALVAAALEPQVVAYLVAGHRSQEPGATAALAELGLEPLLDLNLRLGEGSGAVLAVPLVQAAARLLREVATFEDAGVSEG